MPRLAHKTGDAVQTQGLVENDFGDIIAEYYPYIRRLAFSILDDQDDAEDAAQDAFIAAYRNIDRFRGESSIRTWLSTITINICRGMIRRQKVQRGLQLVLRVVGIQSASQETPEKAAVQNEAYRQVWQAVDELDDKHRLVVILYYVHEMSVPEIAASLGVNQGTVYSRMFYARSKLHTLLETFPSEEEASNGTR